jgi:hypothetical protein
VLVYWTRGLQSAALQVARTHKDLNYKVKHLEAFTIAGYKWPPNLDDVLDDAAVAVTRAQLPQRQAEAAWFFMRQYMDAGITDEIIVDLNPNLDYGARLFSRPCFCLVCTSKPFALRARRELSGYESLSLQGLPFGKIKPATLALGLSTTALNELAGNAFNGFAVQSVFVALFTVIDMSTAPPDAEQHPFGYVASPVAAVEAEEPASHVGGDAEDSFDVDALDSLLDEFNMVLSDDDVDSLGGTPCTE